MREMDELTLYADSQVTISSGGPACFTLSGEVDAWNVAAVTETLARHLPPGDVSLDLSDLSFADVETIRALVSLADGMDDGRRIVIHGLPSRLRRVLELVGWSNMPRFVNESDGPAA
jgi:anti-anti-sigma factor